MASGSVPRMHGEARVDSRRTSVRVVVSLMLAAVLVGVAGACSSSNGASKKATGTSATTSTTAPAPTAPTTPPPPPPVITVTPVPVPANYAPSDTNECVPGPMKTAADYARLWQHRTADWKGGDLGQATTLSDGRIVWALGDNVRANPTAGTLDSMGRWKDGTARVGFAHNGFAVQTGNCMRFVSASPEWIPAVASQKGTDPSQIQWPMSVAETRDHRLVAFLHRFTYPGMAFESTDLAVLDPTSLRPTQMLRTNIPREWYNAVRGPDGQLYVFGAWIPPGKNAYQGMSVYVARATDATLTDPGQWEYWHGSAGWIKGNSAVDTTPIVDGGASWPTVWYDASAKEWHVAFKDHDSLGDHINELAAAGQEPTGKYRKLGEVKVPLPPSYADGQSGWSYAAMIQPDIKVDGGRLVTWSVNREVPPDVPDIEYPFLIGPEMVAWKPGAKPHWGTGAPFSPGYSPVSVVYAPGKVLALQGEPKVANANLWAMRTGVDGSSITDGIAQALTSPDADRSARPVARLFHALVGRPIDPGNYRQLVRDRTNGKSLASIASALAQTPEARQHGAGPDQQAAAVRTASANDTASDPTTTADIAYVVLLDRQATAAESGALAKKLAGGAPLPAVLGTFMSQPDFIGKLFPGATAP